MSSFAAIDEIVFSVHDFWRAEAAFAALPGVETTVGYVGGTSDAPTYHKKGDHADAVLVAYDQRIISLEEIGKVFLRLRQAAPSGTSTSFAVYVVHDDQRNIVQELVKHSDQPADHLAVHALGRFWPAETYHQRFIAKLDQSQ